MRDDCAFVDVLTVQQTHSQRTIIAYLIACVSCVFNLGGGYPDGSAHKENVVQINERTPNSQVINLFGSSRCDQLKTGVSSTSVNHPALHLRSLDVADKPLEVRLQPISCSPLHGEILADGPAMDVIEVCNAISGAFVARNDPSSCIECLCEVRRLPVWIQSHVLSTSARAPPGPRAQHKVGAGREAL